MLRAIVSPLRRTLQALLASDSPSQIAAGFTLGMMIGIMPKTNLIALSLCVLLFSLRCSKGSGIAAMVLFSFATPWTDPVAHNIGLTALSVPALQANYANVFSMPLGPWIGFHNTVVTGALLLGLYVAYPVYWLTNTVFAAIQRGLAG